MENPLAFLSSLEETVARIPVIRTRTKMHSQPSIVGDPTRIRCILDGCDFPNTETRGLPSRRQERLICIADLDRRRLGSFAFKDTAEE